MGLGLAALVEQLQVHFVCGVDYGAEAKIGKAVLGGTVGLALQGDNLQDVAEIEDTDTIVEVKVPTVDPGDRSDRGGAED